LAKVISPIWMICARRRGSLPGSREAGSDKATGRGKWVGLQTANPWIRPSHDSR